MRSIVLATGNKDKLAELRSLMKGSGVTVLSLADFPKMPSVREDGKTFEANAEKKARVYSKRTRSLVLADDSGLEVNALGGAPGVYSARYAGLKCSYADNNRKLLSAMSRVAWPKRKARFVSVIAIFEDGKKIGTVRGECEGKIGYLEKGSNGFGYDPVFIPKGQAKTYAELSCAQKNALSHRGKAFRKATKLVLRHCSSNK
jgi:non-canonical purine NTP pyrophosphatase (RdgB/HAM1 family)